MSREIWMGIWPEAEETRVLAMAGACETIMKARLLREPAHPRALPTLLEAIALWQGTKVRAALCVAERDGASDSNLYRAAFPDVGGPLYTLDWVHAPARGRRRTRDLRGVSGDFAALRQTVLFEVAR